MDNNIVKALLAGLFFGIWPLFMNRSGLNGNLSSFAFAAMVALFVSVVAFKDVGDLSQVKWMFVIAAGAASAVGVLCFNGMLASVDPKQVSTLFVVMIVSQATVPALYGVIMNGGHISLTRAAGFVFALVSAVLLTMKEPGAQP